MTAATVSLPADVHGYGALGSRPAAGMAGREYVDSSTKSVYRDNGTSWDNITPPSGIADPTTTRGDMLFRNSGGAIARLALGAANTVLHGSATDPSYSAVVEADINLTDVTTGNASTSQHGFLKKLDGNAAHYMDGTGAWSTPSGGGGSSIYYPSLKPATPTDDFAVSTLDAAWSAHSSSGSFTTGGVSTARIDGSHAVITQIGQFGAIYRTVANTDWTVTAGGIRMTGSMGHGATSMPGIGLLDSSGNGVAIVIYNDNNIYLAAISAWGYSTNSGNISGKGHGGTNADLTWWLKLTRVGNTWDGYASWTGAAWDYHMSGTRSDTKTIAYLVVGQFLTSVTGEMIVEWVDIR